MGLDVGIISITYLPRPAGHAYDFAWRLAEEANVDGYMGGESNCWGPFTKDEVQALLDEFAAERRLSADQRAEIAAWVDSLPWDGDLIELHFNW